MIISRKLLSCALLSLVFAGVLPAGPLPDSLKSEPHQRDSYGWAARHDAVLKRNKIVKPAYVFFGDSITHWWGGEPKSVMPVVGADSWERLFGKHAVTNCGFGFDYIDNAYYRVENGELDGIAPRVILVNLGTNNIGHRGDTAKICGDNMAAFVQLLREKSPNATILLVGIYPRREPRFADTITAANELYAKIADGKQVFFVNPGLKLLGEKSKLAEAKLMRDQVHLNASGYRIIAEDLAKTLRQIDPQYAAGIPEIESGGNTL